MSWIGVCDAEQVQEDFLLAATLKVKIGVYLIDGEYYALEDVCPHAYALLSQGLCRGRQSGMPAARGGVRRQNRPVPARPGGRNLNRYPVRVFENQIQITFVEETVA